MTCIHVSSQAPAHRPRAVSEAGGTLNVWAGMPPVPLADAGLVLATVAQALGVREAADRPLREALRHALRALGLHSGIAKLFGARRMLCR